MLAPQKSSLAMLPPCNVHRKGLVLTVLKAYCDGSKEDHKALTLACVGGIDGFWEEIEGEWEAVRKQRGNPDYVHMTYLMTLNDIYEKWSPEQRDYLVDGLIGVLLKFRNDPRARVVTCTVDLAAHEKWRRTRNHPSAARLCARVAIPTMMDWYAGAEPSLAWILELYFDRNEPFMRHIDKDWHSRKIRRKYPVWELVRTVAPVKMETTPAVQIADMIAWGKNRQAAGSHWETDEFYTTAVRAAGALGPAIHRTVGEEALSESTFPEEGAEALNRQFRKERA